MRRACASWGNLVNATAAPQEHADEVLVARAWAALAEVADPEIPVISVVDLGIVREVRATSNGVEVAVTPTYAGCPATEVIAADIIAGLAGAGLAATVVTRLAPAWTTDWISPAGCEKLRQYGIAPPGRASGAKIIRLIPKEMEEMGSDPISSISSGDAQSHDMGSDPIYLRCPQCASDRVERLSEFGSTPCKALYRCLACREPFDYMKPL